MWLNLLCCCSLIHNKPHEQVNEGNIAETLLFYLGCLHVLPSLAEVYRGLILQYLCITSECYLPSLTLPPSSFMSFCAEGVREEDAKS